MDNENWDIEFKSTEANKIVISAQGKRLDKEVDPVEIEQAGNKVIVKQNKRRPDFLMVSRLGRKIVYV